MKTPTGGGVPMLQTREQIFHDLNSQRYRSSIVALWVGRMVDATQPRIPNACGDRIAVDVTEGLAVIFQRFSAYHESEWGVEAREPFTQAADGYLESVPRQPVSWWDWWKGEGPALE